MRNGLKSGEKNGKKRSKRSGNQKIGEIECKNTKQLCVFKYSFKRCKNCKILIIKKKS